MMFDKLKYIFDINLDRILAAGESWCRYIVYRDIFKFESQLSKLKEEIINDFKIKTICQRLFDTELGVFSIYTRPVSYKTYSSYYWRLRFLAEIGLTRNDLQFDHIVNQIFIHQLSDGQFTIGYHRKEKIPVSTICLTANLAYSLGLLGYENSRSVQAAINYILTTQRIDGGWHCNRHKQMGEKDQDLSSCPSANINVIRALAIWGNRYQHLLQPAVTQILNHWKNRHQGYRLCDFGIGTTFMKLRYPPHYWGYDILNILDTLSFYPEFCQNKIFDEMVEQIIAKWDGTGLFKSEKSIPDWRQFNFAKNGYYSYWISVLICRIFKRVYFN